MNSYDMDTITRLVDGHEWTLVFGDGRDFEMVSSLTEKTAKNLYNHILAVLEALHDKCGMEKNTTQ